MRATSLLGLAVLSSCAVFQPPSRYPEEWRSGEVTTASERILWEVTVLSFEKADFPLGTGLDPTAMEAVSGWRNNLAPFRGQGFRDRAMVRAERVGPDRYRIDVRVEHQVNMDVSRPLDARYAKWEAAPDDVDLAGVLLQRIQAWVGGELEVGERPRPGS